MKVTDTYNMPIINSHFTDENLNHGIDPVYIQSVVNKVYEAVPSYPPRPAQAPPPPPPSDPVSLVLLWLSWLVSCKKLEEFCDYSYRLCCVRLRLIRHQSRLFRPFKRALTYLDR